MNDKIDEGDDTGVSIILLKLIISGIFDRIKNRDFQSNKYLRVLKDLWLDIHTKPFFCPLAPKVFGSVYWNLFLFQDDLCLFKHL